MIDPVLEAAAEYERTVAPAYEVIRRARAQLLEKLQGDDTIPALGAFVRHADPTEPNGAEYAVEAIDSALGVRDALGVEPEAAVVSPPTARPPAKHRKESFVCSRCPMTFKTRGWRDRHENHHPPVPDVSPAGGRRIRRALPVNGSTAGLGQ